MVVVSQISESDCYNVIANTLSSNDFAILNYHQIGFDEIHGYLGEHSILEIDIERNGSKETHKFFVKSLPRVHSQRQFLLEINGFFKEKQFFTKYCELLKENAIDVLDEVLPRYRFINEDSIIFEDLGSKGYKSLPSRAPLNLDCVKAALVTFAKLHASGLILEETKSFRLVDDFGEELKESFYLGTEATESGLRSCKNGLRALIDITHSDDMKISKDLFRTKALEGCELQKSVVTPSTRFRNTVCHADPWTKNFMFKFEEGRAINCVVVDFQTYRYGPPAQDVLSFIHMVTDRKLRDGHMGEMLDFYWGELDANLAKFGFGGVVSREEFFQSCHYFKRYALTQTLMHFQVVILSDEIANELFADPDKAKSVLFDNKYDFFISVCQQDTIFRERNFQAIAELREFYENQ